jgi:hypothetical protein
MEIQRGIHISWTPYLESESVSWNPTVQFDS